MHYERQRKTGDVGPVGRLKAAPGEGTTTGDGYRRITLVDGRNVAEHRYVMEQIIGRLLLSDETVHHINGVRSDNRPENLELWSSSHPRGQRVQDKVAWAREILALYGDVE